jgi:hypothetical protein
MSGLAICGYRRTRRRLVKKAIAEVFFESRSINSAMHEIPFLFYPFYLLLIESPPLLFQHE